MAAHLDYQEDIGEQAKVLLLWTKCRPPLSQLSNNVVREVCSYLHPRHFILGILKQNIAVFNVQERSFRFATLSMSIPDTCVFSTLGPKSIMILGFRTKSVYSLSFPDLDFALLPEMNRDRSFPGIIRCDPFIYVFGGFSQGSSHHVSSERFNIYEKVWQTLPDMHHRKHCFTPVLHKRCIYLPIFAHINLIECFDIESLTFTVCCVLPDSDSVSIAAAVGDEMVLLTWQKVTRISLGKGVETKRMLHLCGFSGRMEMRNTPQVIGREVWGMLAEEFRVIRYSVDINEITSFQGKNAT